MGLHGSPTCSIGFEGAKAWLLGDLGRGLPQMFVMITNMRLSVAAAGLGLAGACSDMALAYARDRRQGGPAGSNTPIIRHRDVRRQLMTDAAQVTVFRSLLLSASNLADIAQFSDDAEEAAEANSLSQWLLPIVKTTGGQLQYGLGPDQWPVFPNR
jgi:alkylation response protein AidB-like acyl-CoA dehydrogenase